MALSKRKKSEDISEKKELPVTGNETGGNEKKETVERRLTEYIFEIIKVVLISLAIIVPVRYFLIQPFYVKGASMEPNFFDSQYLIINELSYRLSAPERGDIVVFKYPRDTSQYFIKRVIGLPNETLEIKDGKITIYNGAYPDGLVLDETYLDPSAKTLGSETITLGPDQYFVMGDNRLESFDSRSFGPVNKSYIVGKVWIRGWPFNELKIFETPQYN